MKKDFDLDYEKVVPVEPVIYGDFMFPSADPRLYAEIDDFKQMKTILDLFNFVNAQNKEI